MVWKIPNFCIVFPPPTAQHRGSATRPEQCLLSPLLPSVSSQAPMEAMELWRGPFWRCIWGIGECCGLPTMSFPSWMSLTLYPMDIYWTFTLDFSFIAQHVCETLNIRRRYLRKPVFRCLMWRLLPSWRCCVGWLSPFVDDITPSWIKVDTLE